MRAFTSSMKIDAGAAAQVSQDFWRKWQETISDVTETWLEASKAKGPANILSAQVEFGIRNAQRWYGWAPAEATEPIVEAAEPAAELNEAAAPTCDQALVTETIEAAAEPSAPVKPDDLKRIRGIGPAIELKLHQQGVTTYRQIADMTAADIEALDAVLDFRGRIERDGWTEQAGQLALRTEAE